MSRINSVANTADPCVLMTQTLEKLFIAGVPSASEERIRQVCEREFGVHFSAVGVRSALTEAAGRNFVRCRSEGVWELSAGPSTSAPDMTLLSSPRTPATPRTPRTPSSMQQQQLMDVSLESVLHSTPAAPLTPASPRAMPFDASRPINFPNRRRTVLAHLAIRVIKLVNVRRNLEGCRLAVAWKWGSKEGNRGASEWFVVTNSTALVVYSYQVVTEFNQELPSKATEQNRMVISLVLQNANKTVETLCSRTIDMSQFSLDRCEKTKSFALEKKEPAMSLLLSVETTWLKIDGKKVERTVDGFGQRVDGDAPEIEAMPLASPTQFPGLAPRPNTSRSHAVSPVVMHQAMKEGRKAEVIEGAKTPNHMLDKMLESEKALVSRRPAPAPPTELTSISTTPAAITVDSTNINSNNNNNNNNNTDSPMVKRKGLLNLVVSPVKRSPVKSPASNPGTPSSVASSPMFKRKEGMRKAREEAREIGAPATAVFGLPLEKVMKMQEATHPGLKVPFVVDYCCTKVMELDGHRSEGIFRISINSEDVDIYSRNFDRGQFSLPPRDPNYPAVLLKHYLRKLPEPLCPDYDACIDFANHVPGAKTMHEIFSALPQHNRDLLVYLADFIVRLGDASNVPYTKMEIAALCIVFVPAVLKCPVLDYAVALRNQALEQRFMQDLILWIRERKTAASASKEQASAAVAGGMKKRKSVLDMENANPASPVAVVARSPSFKGLKSSSESSPSSGRKELEELKQ